MAFRPWRVVPKRKRGKKAMRKRVYRKRKLSTMRTFTECLQASPVYTNSGGIFRTRMSDVPQLSAYAKLYSQFAIRKLKVVLLPKYGPSEPNAALAGLTAVDVQNIRLAYAVNDTPDKIIPASELDVLTDNGAKVVTGHRKITLTCRPKPDLQMRDALSGAFPAVRRRGLTWLNFDNSETGSNGETIEHDGISYWCTQGNFTIAPFEAFDVYYYVTFSVRDPC